MTARLVLPGLLLVACAGTPPAPPAVHLQQLDIPFAERHPELVEIWLHRGRVLVRPGRELACSIDVSVRGETDQAAQALARAVAIKLEDGKERTAIALRHAPGADLDAVDVSYVLTVPGHVALRITTRTGEIAVRGYQGSATVNSESGRIHARLDGGQAQLQSRLGAIRLEGRFRNADLSTHSGTIEVVLPDAPPAAVRVSAVSEDGPLRLDMAENCRMALELRLGAARFTSDFPLQWLSEEDVADPRAQHRFGMVNGEAGDAQIQAVLASGTGAVALRRLPPGTRTGRAPVRGPPSPR